MGWFSKTPEPEEPEPQYVRLASDEFISGLTMMAEMYERRETMHRAQLVPIAEMLARKTHLNFGEMDRLLDEMRGNIDNAFDNMAAASELRGWINDYLYRGARPPYMPPAPAVPNKPSEGE